MKETATNGKVASREVRKLKTKPILAGDGHSRQKKDSTLQSMDASSAVNKKALVMGFGQPEEGRNEKHELAQTQAHALLSMLVTIVHNL
jgi:hypothetical protein